MSFLFNKKPKRKQYNYQQGIPTLPRSTQPTPAPLVQYQRPPVNIPRTPQQQQSDNQLQRILNQNYLIANPAPPKVPNKPPHLKYKKYKK